MPLMKVSGTTDNWVSAKNYVFSRTQSYAGECLPTPETFDFLILIGGLQCLRISSLSLLQRDELVQAAN